MISHNRTNIAKIFSVIDYENDLHENTTKTHRSIEPPIPTEPEGMPKRELSSPIRETDPHTSAAEGIASDVIS